MQSLGEGILFREYFKLPKPFSFYRFKKIHFCKSFETQARQVQIPHHTFDFMILSSRNALKFLKVRPTVRRSLEGLHGPALLKFFRRQGPAKGRSVLYLRSKLGAKLGRADIVPRLRSMGYRVTIRCTYDTRILKIRDPLLKLLKSRPIKAFLVSSPSSVVAIERALGRRALQGLEVRWIPIGDTTGAFLKEKKRFK